MPWNVSCHISPNIPCHLISLHTHQWEGLSLLLGKPLTSCSHQGHSDKSLEWVLFRWNHLGWTSLGLSPSLTFIRLHLNCHTHYLPHKWVSLPSDFKCLEDRDRIFYNYASGAWKLYWPSTTTGTREDSRSFAIFRPGHHFSCIYQAERESGVFYK